MFVDNFQCSLAGITQTITKRLSSLGKLGLLPLSFSESLRFPYTLILLKKGQLS
jgi:hypothetical protein